MTTNLSPILVKARVISMTISFDIIYTRYYYITILLLSMLFSSMAHTEDNITQQLLDCRKEASPLLRLDCYDNILKEQYGDTEKITHPAVNSVTAARILAQEKQRNVHMDDFIITEAQGPISKEIILSRPALGVKPPRPVLAFSCLDHITRMQIVLFQPLQANASRTFILKTNTGETLNMSWFIRDNGYLIESSRGLPGISQIQRLFGAETLYIESDHPSLNGLSFNIHNLAQEIIPLRQACRW